ncbi:MAG: hypothetical protein GX638_18760 [Crenarchaeota archaeon]|nr:hypothetical protein [Thermoproteota archaeon]
MAFGIKSSSETNAESYTEDNSVEVAELKDATGTITEMTTHGGKKEVSEEFFLPSATTTITNEAVNGQSGATDIVTKHTLTEKNNEYQKVSITKVSALAAPTP